MSDHFKPRREHQPIEGLVIRALTRKQKYHSTLVVYHQLLMDADVGMENRSNSGLAEEVDLGVAAVKRSLRILRRLGLVRTGEDTRLNIVTHTSEPIIIKVLAGIDKGVVDLDIQTGKVWAPATGREFDYTTFVAQSEALGRASKGSGGSRKSLSPHYSGSTESQLSHSGGSTESHPTTPGGSTESHRLYVEPEKVLEVPAENGVSASQAATSVFDAERGGSSESHPPTKFPPLYSSITLTSTSNTKPISREEFVPYSLDEVKRFYTSEEKMSAKFNHHRDPTKADIEAVQQHANALFGTKHGLLHNDQPNDRYANIFALLHRHGFTVADLCTALDEAKRDQWWMQRGIVDTAKLLRKMTNVQQWVDRASGAAPRPMEKRDMRALDCAPLAEGQVATSFEF